MASYTLDITNGDIGVYAKTAVANTEDTVNVTKPGAGSYSTIPMVVVSDGTAALYITIDGTVATVAGVATRELPAGGLSKFTFVLPVGSTKVRLISAGTPKYSVSREA